MAKSKRNETKDLLHFLNQLLTRPAPINEIDVSKDPIPVQTEYLVPTEYVSSEDKQDQKKKPKEWK